MAQKGLGTVLNQSPQNTQTAGDGSKPLAGIGDALQKIGASLNNGTSAGAGGGKAPAPAPAPAAGGKKPAPEDKPAPDNSGLLANPAEITSNITGGIGSVLGNLTSGLSGGQKDQQQKGNQPQIAPPPGIGTKSSAGAAGVTQLASLVAAAVVLVQLLA